MADTVTQRPVEPSVEANAERARTLLSRDWRMLIGGLSVTAASGGTYETINPATGRALATVPSANADDVDGAVQAAERALPAWRALSVSARAQHVEQAVRIIEAHAADIALVDAIDSGNPVAAMRRDVESACRTIRFLAGIVPEVKGATIPASAGNLHLTLREPYGVVGRIIPFNHPFLFASSKVAAPLLTGNTVVLKAPDQTPLAPLYFAELVKNVFPPGVLNVITGAGDVAGAALVRHPRVKRVAVTGSVETGRTIQRAAAESAVKHVSLELGGKNAMIVCADADLDRAVAGAVTGMNFQCQGQSCGSTSRVFVHREIYDEFLARLAAGVQRIRVGLPIDPATEMGCLVSRRQFDRVMGYIASGLDEGAALAAGGEPPADPALTDGYFLLPTVFGDVRQSMRVAREEIFGPVVSVLRWEDESDVLQCANATPYGLTGAIWTRDLDRAFRLARQLETGFVWINGSSHHFPGVPFGGYKESGVGHEQSLEELLSYTQIKSINIMLAGS
jgi:betaine-aldehyde dehydrogenase